MFRLDDRVAIITGAATGLGQAIAVALASAGARLAISDQPEVPLDETAALAGEHGREVFCFPMDVRDLRQIAEGFAAVDERFGRLDILVNNAGINRRAPAWRSPRRTGMTTSPPTSRAGSSAPRRPPGA